MNLQLCLVFLFLSLKGSYSKIELKTSSTYGLFFLCGCGSAEQYNTSIQMKCRENKVIQMEPYSYVMRESVGKNSDCGKLKNKCKTSFPDVLHLQDSIEVSKKCSFKNSCDLKIAGVEEGKQRFMNYPFYCHSVNAVHDISVKIDIIQNNTILYFSGKNHTGQKIDCDCFVTGSATIRLEIYFIHLKPTSCSQVKFLSRNVQLFGCSTNDTTMLHVRYFYIDSELKLEIRDMEPDKEDVLFFRLWGSSLSVNCIGCTKSKDDRPTSSIDTTVNPEHPPTTGRQTTAPLTTDSATGRSISAGNTDHPNNDNYPALFGGILAAIIIINIVGIGIYCYIRIRRKRQRTPNNLQVSIKGNIAQNNYDEVAHGDIQGSSHAGDSANSKTHNDRPMNNNFDPADSTNIISGSNNQYHVLEMDNYSTPLNACTDKPSEHNGAKQKAGNQKVKKDDYDHINNGTKAKISQPIHDDTYSHIDAKMAGTRDATANSSSPGDDYDHIGNQNGLLNGKLNPVHGEKKKQMKIKNESSQKDREMKSYVNVNFDPDESTSSKRDTENTEDVDTYNHLQNDL